MHRLAPTKSTSQQFMHTVLETRSMYIFIIISTLLYMLRQYDTLERVNKYQQVKDASQLKQTGNHCEYHTELFKLSYVCYLK